MAPTRVGRPAGSVAAPPRRGRTVDLGLVMALLSAATFASSGPFAKALLVTGWSSGAVVLLRIGGAGLLLLVPAVLALRGRWGLVRRNVGPILLYSALAVAGCQVAYFNAVQRLSIGVALLLEYLGAVLVVGWVWLRTRRRPPGLTGLGVLLALGGLALVLDLGGRQSPDAVGVLWGLGAAVGLAGYFVLGADEGGLPPIALAGAGTLLGAVLLAGLGGLGALPLRFSLADVSIAQRQLPWWSAILELAVVAAAAAYLLGIVGARMLGSTVASFVGLTEVPFAVLAAWLLLGELPRPVQLAGGVLIVAGVVAVRIAERRRPRPLPAA